MLEQFIHIDRDLFLAINQGLGNPFFDWLLPILRNPYAWAPLYLFLVVFFIRQYGKMGVLVVVFALASAGTSDAVSSHLVKKSVKRLRPCNEPGFKELVHARAGCGGAFSFTSSHAANHFAMAFFWIALFRRRWKHTLWLCMAWASLISFSQIYVGVHYPADIICGALLGVLIGTGMGHLFRRFFSDFFSDNPTSPTTATST